MQHTILILSFLIQTIGVAGDRPPRYVQAATLVRNQASPNYRSGPRATVKGWFSVGETSWSRCCQSPPRDDKAKVFDFQKLISNMPRDKH